MVGTVYLPFRPIKGQAFTLTYANSTSGMNSGAADPLSITIYKDGGSGNASTNSSTLLGLGNRTLVLTSAEMDADVVIVHFEYSSASTGGAEGSVIIYTTVSELAAAPTLNSSIADKITAIFQYLFFKRTVTATVETLYKNDDSTTIATNTLADNGTTFTKGKLS